MPRYRTADQVWVRERNLAIILNYLWESAEPISRAQLTVLSGLNKSTVGSLVQQLVDWGYIHEVGMSEPRPGRPGVLLDIDPAAGRIIGAEIGVDFVSVVMSDFRAEVLWRHKEARPLDETPAASMERLSRIIAKAAGEAAKTDMPVLGIGLCVPGLVDRDSGTLLFAPNLAWRDIDLRDPLQERFGVPVFVENEANAAALGEQFLGVAQQVPNVIYLSAGVGLGGGLIINGNLFGGADGFAGEVGHMVLQEDGQPCNCGNRGCWETLVGPTAVVRRIQALAAGGAASQILDHVDGDVSAIRMEHVLAAAEQGDELVLQVLDEVGRFLGLGIANLVNALNPQLVVLGGMLSLAGPYILESARQEVRARAMKAPSARVEIRLSAFRFDASVMGGLTLVLREILADPLGWKPQEQPAAAPRTRSGWRSTVR